VSTRMCRFLPLIFLPASYPCWDQCAPPFSAPFFTLLLRMMAAVGLASRCSRSRPLFIERVVGISFQRAVICPQIEIAIDRAFRRQVFRDRAPLTAGRENVHQAVHHLPHDHRALASATLARRDQRFDQPHSSSVRSLGLSQLAAGRNGPGSCLSTSVTPPRHQATSLDITVMIHMIQELFGQTLSACFVLGGNCDHASAASIQPAGRISKHISPSGINRPVRGTGHGPWSR